MGKITKSKSTNDKPETPRKDNNTTTEVTELKAIVESLQSKVATLEKKSWNLGEQSGSPGINTPGKTKIPVTSCQRNLINSLSSSTNYTSTPDGTVLLYPEFPSKEMKHVKT